MSMKELDSIHCIMGVALAPHVCHCCPLYNRRDDQDTKLSSQEAKNVSGLWLTIDGNLLGENVRVKWDSCPSPHFNTEPIIQIS